MTKYVDSKRIDKNFPLAQLVWVKFHHYRQKSTACMLNLKLAKRYFDPFQITKRVGPVAYRLALPQGSKIHPVLYIFLLKLYTGPDPPTTMVYEEFQNQPFPTPQAIIAKRTICSAEGDQYQV